jgi:hypothetical protein
LFFAFPNGFDLPKSKEKKIRVVVGADASHFGWTQNKTQLTSLASSPRYPF